MQCQLVVDSYYSACIRTPCKMQMIITIFIDLTSTFFIVTFL